MNGQAAVTIGVRTYDRNVLLTRALESVLAQTFTDWRLVLLNNGGDREALDQTIEPYLDRIGDRLTMVHAPERHPIGWASNAVLDGIDTKYFTHHDDDDAWDPTFLERTVAVLEETGDDVLGVATQFHRIREQINPDGTVEEVSRKHDNPTFDFTSFQLAFMGCLAPPIAMLYKTRARELAGPFDEDLALGDDWEFQLRVLTLGRIEVIPEPLALRFERVAGDSYSNLSNRRREVLLNNSFIRDRFSEKPMREGQIPPTEVALAISEADRQNHERINESLDHVRELRLQMGDIDNRTQHVLGLLERYDSALRAMRMLLLPVIWLRRAAGRLKRRGQQ